MDLRSKSKNKVDSSKSAGGKSSREKEVEDDYVYAPVGVGSSSNTGREQQEVRHKYLERTMFVVDLSRLKAERDTLENAIVMYKPEKEFKRQQYEQRCSQLVGLSLCTMNLTGKYPEFLRLKGTGYAIQGLGEHYIMGLSSRIEEPAAYCVNYLKTIHDLFRFYYHSPRAVLKASGEEWEVFTQRMTEHLSNIMRYILRDQHSVPAMLNPLPYVQAGYSSPKKNGSRNFLLASRVLRACQNHAPILGGCIMHNKDLLMTQFPSDFTEKLLLVGGGAIPLDKKSVLGDNIAPGTVWVLEVFLNLEEKSQVLGFHKDLSSLKNAYASLNRATRVTMPSLAQRQSSIDSGPDPVRSKGHWRRRTAKAQMQSGEASPTGTEDRPPTQPSQPSHPSQGTASLTPTSPVSSSTPLSKDRGTTEPAKKPKVASNAIVLSPGLSTVFFDKGSPELQHRTSSSSSGRLDADESEYVDAVETIESLSSLEQVPESKGVQSSLAVEARPASISSEVFATPSPSPPRELEESSSGDSKKGDTLTRDEDTGKTGFNPADLTNEELAKLINTPVFVETPDKSSKITTVTSMSKSHAMAVPPSWKFRAAPESDDEDDFVDSDALQAMLAQKPRSSTVKSRVDDDFVDANDVVTMVQSSFPKTASKSSPPPLPPRNSVSSRPMSHPSTSSSGASLHTPPPLPPRNYTMGSHRTSKTPEESTAESQESPQSNQWLYKTMSRDASGTTSAEEGAGKRSSEHSYEEVSPLDEEESGSGNGEDTSTTPLDAYTPDMAGEYLLSGKNTEDLVPNSVDTVDTQGSSLEPATVETSQVRDSEATGGHQVDIYGDSPKLSDSRKVVDSPSLVAETIVDRAAESGSGIGQDLDDMSVVKSKAISYESQPGIDQSVDQRSFLLTSEVESSFEYIPEVPDGTNTPTMDSMAFNPSSLVDGLPLKLKLLRHKLKAPTVPPRHSPKQKRPKDDDELSETDSSSDGDYSVGSLDDGRGKWLPTIKRPQSGNASRTYVSKMCLYVQQYMGTEVILLGSDDLHKNHSVLNSLWRSLLQQLTELENSLRKEQLSSRDKPSPKPPNVVVTYSGMDQRCEAMPHTTAYHFRHALRRVHQEYASDPSLMQISLSKEHLRLMSQNVHKREVYLQPSRLGHLDVLSMHGAVEKYAKTKSSLRQQPTGSPKVMFV